MGCIVVMVLFMPCEVRRKNVPARCVPCVIFLRVSGGDTDHQWLMHVCLGPSSLLHIFICHPIFYHPVTSLSPPIPFLPYDSLLQYIYLILFGVLSLAQGQLSPSTSQLTSWLLASSSNLSSTVTGAEISSSYVYTLSSPPFSLPVPFLFLPQSSS